jgi:hypothetical protein
MRVFLLAWAVSFSLSSVAGARDCSLSKEFQIKKPQALVGVLQDPSGAVLAGIDLQLLSGNRVVHHVATTNEGAYDFGSIARESTEFVLRREVALCAHPKSDARRKKGALSNPGWLLALKGRRG